MAYTNLDSAALGRISAIEGAVQQVVQTGGVAYAATGGALAIEGDGGNAATFDANGVPDFGAPLPAGYDQNGSPKPAGQYDQNGAPKPAGDFNFYGVPTPGGGYNAAGQPQLAGGYDASGVLSPAGIYNELGSLAGVAYWVVGSVPGSAPIQP